ncbi:DNA-packaging protein [Sphingomonas sp.]|uniref:DNA-packaging protein n=1 Tax=Sphingomonas sp. TaxID=28214 RepID=UPI002ED8DA17
MTAAAPDVVALLAALSEEDRRVLIGRLSRGARRELNERWIGGWAQAGQHVEGDGWRVWLIRAGRGFGKTRAGAEWVSEVARRNKDAQIALVGATADDVRRVMIEGPSGVCAVARTTERVRYRRDSGEVVFPSGARAFVYSAMAAEGLRGPEHDAAWCDELAKWTNGDAAWDNLMMGMRRGANPQVLVTTTPRPTPLMRRVMALPGLVETGGRTRDNAHLPAAFVEAVEATYAGTRLGRQELDGEMIEDVEGALWTRGGIEACRVREAPAWKRVVVGVDPPAGTASGRGGDACGIVAVAKGGDGRAYVIEDASVVDAAPHEWARAVAACAARVGADRVIAEANQGGEMVRAVLVAADMALPVRLVRATQGKAARAEPVAALYEAGKALHVGAFPALEDELCGLVVGGGYEGPGRSPDRADALVWAMTDLMLRRRRVEAAVRPL